MEAESDMKWFRWVYADGERPSSWHRIKFTSRAGHPFALCGRWSPAGATAVQAETFPLGDRTCETCLRLDSKRTEDK